MKAAKRPLPVPSSTSEPCAKLREARRINAQIGEVARRGRRATAELAFLLSHVVKNRLHEALGYADVGVFAVTEGHVATERKARDLVALVKLLARLPRTREGFREGRIFWTKIRTVGPVLTPENEGEWQDDLRKLSVRQLEAKVAEAQGKPVSVRRTYEFTPEGEAWVKRRVAEVRKEARKAGETISEGEALARICKGDSEDASARSGSPTNRVVIHACECGQKATIETRDGPVAVSKETFEQALCDAEIVDTRGGPKKITKTIPEKTRRQVQERDRGRCTVPGCKNMGHIHVHHEGGRLNVGHDPEHMTTLCTAHHPSRHRDTFAIEGTRSTGFRFVLPDGQELKAPSRGEPAPMAVRSVVADMQLAKAALTRLELPARKAGELVSRAREGLEARGEACSVEALVKLALERS
jgi:hypothetical protein